MKPSRLYLPLAGPYWALVALRNFLFDTGIFRTHRVGLPVVSVGNLNAGGTGKTPFVVLLARMISQEGLRPAVVARGYGRKGSGRVVLDERTDVRVSGDEPAMIARSVNGSVVVDRSKRRAAEWISQEHLGDVIIVDDGFQHRWLGRDLDIVLVTAKELHEQQWLLPAGYRREPLGSLSRADLVVVTGCRRLPDFETARERLSWLKGVPVIGSRLVPESVLEVSTMTDLDLRGRSVVAFSGIGNPASFEETLRDLGAEIVESLAFPDHHWFTSLDLATVESARKRNPGAIVATTEKDFVRIRARGPAVPEGLALVRVRQEILAGMEHLNNALGGIMQRTREQN